MPLQATSGAASYDAFGGGVAAVPNYIEDVFSTWLYTGTGATQTINNGIDLAGKGGIVWIAGRSTGISPPIYTTDIGTGKTLFTTGTAGTNANTYNPASQDLMSFNSNGFTLGTNWAASTNSSGATRVSWTFRKQPKFFDVVTYTGNGASNRQIAHNLGSVPGCIIVKRTDDAGDWWVYHRSIGATKYLTLNSTSSEATYALWGDTNPTSTNFTVNFSETNGSGRTYVAYLFAHNAGGFGLTGTDNVISCGSYVGAGTTEVNVNLGYEPQWLLIKNATGTSDWTQIDTMRGMTVNNGVNRIRPNQSFGEAVTSDALAKPTATGFTVGGTSDFNWLTESGKTFIYIAIRRGPMKVPTTGTSVYNALDLTGTGSTVVRTGAGFTPDLLINRAHANDQTWWADRLRGVKAYLGASNTNAESGSASGPTQDLISFDMNGVTFGSPNFAGFNNSGSLEINWLFKRAPGFFDEVCYTGTGSATTFAHNLAAVPELMIVKERNGANGWQVYSASLTNTDYLILNTSAGVPSPSATRWNSTTPTSTVFSVGTHGATNGSGQNFVNYLFATCPGVSKVGSYAGTGTTQTINCGFTGGARFVLIKRTDSTGDWYVWDSARGIVAGNDPYLLLNSTAAEVTNTDYVDTAATGFEISSTAPAEINASGGTYIFLAIA
jgi:hypothetical protein